MRASPVLPEDDDTDRVPHTTAARRLIEACRAERLWPVGALPLTRPPILGLLHRLDLIGEWRAAPLCLRCGLWPGDPTYERWDEHGVLCEGCQRDMQREEQAVYKGLHLTWDERTNRGVLPILQEMTKRALSESGQQRARIMVRSIDRAITIQPARQVYRPRRDRGRPAGAVHVEIESKVKRIHEEHPEHTAGTIHEMIGRRVSLSTVRRYMDGSCQ